MYAANPSITSRALSGGILVSTLTPFDDAGSILFDAISDDAKRIACIDGVRGIAVNTTRRERLTLMADERYEITRRTRAGLKSGQLLLACVGQLSKAVAEDVLSCKAAGADAVIAFPPRWRDGIGTQAFDDHLMQLSELADSLSLPIVIAHGAANEVRHGETTDQITALARSCRQVIGVDMGRHDNVLYYDQAYYALKAIDRPLACLPSSEAALFHNLNTGADGVLSCLAYIAPHEVTSLYEATKTESFCEAQALHNRLSPLIGLISGHDKTTRELVLRSIAHRRGLLASSNARGIDYALGHSLTRSIENTLKDIALKPVGAN